MVKIYLITVVLYSLFVVICLVRMNVAKRRRKEVIGKGETVRIERNNTEIIGKSTFKKPESKPSASKPEPATSTLPEQEKAIGKDDTFVPSVDDSPSAVVPPEELEEAFSDTPPDEDEELLDIDYPLEYEADEPDPSDEEEDESEELEGMAQAALASGLQFEELGNVVRTIYKKEEANRQERKAAGDTLLEIRQTDMFEQLVTGKPDVRELVTTLMAASLADFYRRKDKEAGNTGSGRKAPDTFDIHNFI